MNKSIDITSKDTLENIFLNLCTDDNSIQIQLIANVVVYRFIHSELLRMSDWQSRIVCNSAIVTH